MANRFPRTRMTRRCRLALWALSVAIALVSLGRGSVALAQEVRTAAPIKPEDLPARKTPGAPRPLRSLKPWTAPRTPWGDPDIAGVFTNNDESGIPFERPRQFDGRRPEDITSDELADVVKQ